MRTSDRENLSNLMEQMEQISEWGLQHVGWLQTCQDLIEQILSTQSRETRSSTNNSGVISCIWEVLEIRGHSLYVVFFLIFIQWFIYGVHNCGLYLWWLIWLTCVEIAGCLLQYTTHSMNARRCPFQHVPMQKISSLFHSKPIRLFTAKIWC